MIWHLKEMFARTEKCRWFEFLRDILKNMDFLLSKPTIMKHMKRQAYINVHVDDELLAANKEDGEWVIVILSQKRTQKINGPYPEIEDKKMLHLKKIFKFVEGGVLVPQ